MFSSSFHGALSPNLNKFLSNNLKLSPGNHPFNPIQDGPFRGCLLTDGGEPKRAPSLKSVTHTLQLGTIISYLKKTPKKYESRDTPLDLCHISIFHRKSANFTLSENTYIDSILVNNF